MMSQPCHSSCSYLVASHSAGPFFKVLLFYLLSYHFHIQLYLNLGLGNGPVRGSNFADPFVTPPQKKRKSYDPAKDVTLHKSDSRNN